MASENFSSAFSSPVNIGMVEIVYARIQGRMNQVRYLLVGQVRNPHATQRNFRHVQVTVRDFNGFHIHLSFIVLQ